MTTIIKTISFGIFTVMFFSCNSSENKTLSANNQKTEASVDSTKGPSAKAIAAVAKKQQSSFLPMKLNKILQTQWICAGQIPTGWLKVGGQWNPTACGNPTTIYENVWLIERYDDKPVGAVMTICAQPIPDGWVKIGGSWNPTICGSPSTIQDNVLQIKRLN